MPHGANNPRVRGVGSATLRTTTPGTTETKRDETGARQDSTRSAIPTPNDAGSWGRVHGALTGTGTRSPRSTCPPDLGVEGCDGVPQPARPPAHERPNHQGHTRGGHRHVSTSHVDPHRGGIPSRAVGQSGTRAADRRDRGPERVGVERRRGAAIADRRRPYCHRRPPIRGNICVGLDPRCRRDAHLGDLVPRYRPAMQTYDGHREK